MLDRIPGLTRDYTASLDRLGIASGSAAAKLLGRVVRERLTANVFLTSPLSSETDCPRKGKLHRKSDTPQRIARFRDRPLASHDLPRS